MDLLVPQGELNAFYDPLLEKKVSLSIICHNRKIYLSKKSYFFGFFLLSLINFC